MNAVLKTSQVNAPHPKAGDLLYTLDGRFSEIIVIGPVAEGFRLNGHFGGTVQTGPLAGTKITGVDYFLLRQDGMGVVCAHEVMHFGESVIAARLTGLLRPPHGVTVPGPADVVRPGFAWPAEPYTIHASAMFETAAPELAWLNGIMVAHGGTVNLATGLLHVEARVVG